MIAHIGIVSKGENDLMQCIIGQVGNEIGIPTFACHGRRSGGGFSRLRATSGRRKGIQGQRVQLNHGQGSTGDKLVKSHNGGYRVVFQIRRQEPFRKDFPAFVPFFL